MTAQFNPEVRALYEDIIKRNVVPRDEFDYMPQRYGGGRVREEALCGNDGHYPSISQIENSNFGGAYGRSPHPIAVGSGRKCGGIGVLKQARVEPFINELDQDYMPVSASHGSGRAPRLTKKLKEQILAQHPQLMAHHLRGGAINWGKIWKGIKDTASFVSKAAPVVSSLSGPEYSDTIDKVGNVSGAISGMGRGGNFAHMAAIDIGRRAMKRKGSGFWQDFGTGFKQGMKGVAKYAAPALDVASVFQPELMPLAAATTVASKAMGNGRGGMTAHRRKSVGYAKNKARGAIVRQLMREKGMSLGQASSFIKQHNIPF